MEDKKTLRNNLAAARSNINETVRREAPGQCLVHLSKLREFQESEWVYLYLSYRTELDTISMLSPLWKQGKRIAVPRVYGKDMKFHEITGLHQCEIGNFQIKEPLKSCPVVKEKGIILLPGLGFDKQGNRMGYGGGFYDRYLCSHPDMIKIGLAFEEQIVDHIPTQEHDIIMDYILTPSGLFLPGFSSVFS